ncbi:spore protease YyaC [Inediibacterium massiliense]|uniref:spore protease YyaC n=1 Tax=Inediibacterium massiliense TaxID=1658111 RepID=UPI0006B537DD|nr:spore protease YyaC [Inediibacterium massiliense]
MDATVSLPPKSIHVDTPMASHHLQKVLTKYLDEYYTNEYGDLIILCIGTDRSTGDSLGPLIGYKLEKHFKNKEGIFVHGTLNDPVHAKNLDTSIEFIYKTYDTPFIIAIDASLGRHESIGQVTIGYGPIKPGAGVNKDLTYIGNIHITGVVNLGGFMEYMVLQNTRLSIVMNMADMISDGILYSIWRQLRKVKKEQSFVPN